MHFALYKQVTGNDGSLRKDYRPMPGYEDLATDTNGILEKISFDLQPGTYYLTEVTAASGYRKLAEDIIFTIKENGTVEIDETHPGRLDIQNVNGKVSYSIVIPNTQLTVTLQKTDDDGNALTGARFTLARKTGSVFEAVSGFGTQPGGVLDLTAESSISFTGLPDGVYQLTETAAPTGYVILSKSICFTIRDGSIALTDENGSPVTSSQASVDGTTLKVANTPGLPLPSTGGIGTHPIQLAGAALILSALAGSILLRFRRRRQA